VFTFKQGRVADRGHEAQQFRASGLNLVIAAIVSWNSTYIADAVAHGSVMKPGAGWCLTTGAGVT
jgi:TnpA family transposase